MVAAPTSHFVHVNGLRLHVLEWGPCGGKPVLLLHGGSAHARWWDFVAPVLANRHRVLALDLRGHGDSDWADAGEYQLRAHAADVAALVHALELDQLQLVGHSFGGLVALAAVSALTPRLGSLALVDTSGRIDTRGLRYLKALSHWPSPAYATQQEGVRRFRLLPSAHAASPAVLAHVAGHALRRDSDDTWRLKFDRRTLALDEPIDLVPVLATLTLPVLIVRGALSTHVTPRAVAAMQAALAHGTAAEIAGAHHHVLLDEPEALAHMLLDFFAAAARDSSNRSRARSC